MRFIHDALQKFPPRLVVLSRRSFQQTGARSRQWRRAACADRATPNSTANCATVQPAPASVPRATSKTDWSRLIDRAIRLCRFPGDAAAPDRGTTGCPRAECRARSTVRCEPISGMKRAVAFGRVSVPVPAIWSCSVTHWATMALIGKAAMLVSVAEPQHRRSAAVAGIAHDLAGKDFGQLQPRGADQKFHAGDFAELLGQLVKCRGAPFLFLRSRSCSRTRAVSVLMIRPMTSITAKVRKYCALSTLKL